MTNSQHSADDYDAAQPDPREPVGHVHIRISREHKGHWVQYFRDRKQTLPGGIIAVIDEATGYEGK